MDGRIGERKGRRRRREGLEKWWDMHVHKVRKYWPIGSYKIYRATSLK